jgi:hypothetical protein
MGMQTSVAGGAANGKDQRQKQVLRAAQTDNLLAAAFPHLKIG